MLLFATTFFSGRLKVLLNGVPEPLPHLIYEPFPLSSVQMIQTRMPQSLFDNQWISLRLINDLHVGAATPQIVDLKKQSVCCQQLTENNTNQSFL